VVYSLLGKRKRVWRSVACREWIKHHTDEIPRIEVLKAVQEIVQRATTDGKSGDRLKQLSAMLNRFAENFNVGLQNIFPASISQYLARLPFAERTHRNHRDVIGFPPVFCTSKLGQPSEICLHANEQNRRSGLSPFLFIECSSRNRAFPSLAHF
jgi:hypothetical protein